MKAARGRARSINRRDMMGVCYHNNGDVEVFLSTQKKSVLVKGRDVWLMIELLSGNPAKPVKLKHHPALNDEDVSALFAAGDSGDEAEMQRIVESRGLIWYGNVVEPASVETSHLQPRDR